MRKSILFMAMSVLLVAGCYIPVAPPSAPPANYPPAPVYQAPAPPVVTNFTATPAFVNPGQSTTLTWNVQGASSVRIDPGLGTVAPSGSQTVSPGYTTTYVLTANNPGGVITNTTVVSVSWYPSYSTGSQSYPPYPVYPYNSYYSSMPVIVIFSIDPPVVAPGETALMRWDVAGTDTVNISPYPGQVASSGAITITPGVTTYYSLTATNSFGSSYASATVSVYPYTYYQYPTPNPYIVPFSSQEEEQEQNVIPPVVTPPPPVTTPPPPVTTPPPPRGEGNGGRDDGGRLPRIEAFSSSPSNIGVGNSAQLQWRTNGASTVNITPNIGSVPPSGTMTVSPNHTTNYKITVSNSAGVVQHTQEVTVPRMIRPKGD
jgi:hypothetical protein